LDARKPFVIQARPLRHAGAEIFPPFIRVLLAALSAQDYGEIHKRFASCIAGLFHWKFPGGWGLTRTL
jgi:hypothetical protein